jgi:hypothetical protein
MRYALLGLTAALAVAAALGPALAQNEGIGVLRPYQLAGERFAPVTLTAGQGARVLIANVLLPDAQTQSSACPVVVRFFGGDGAMQGIAEASLPAGVTRAVIGPSTPGLVRAIVSIKDAADPNRSCAVKSTFEVYNIRTGATELLMASDACLGNGACHVTLTAPRRP